MKWFAVLFATTVVAVFLTVTSSMSGVTYTEPVNTPNNSAATLSAVSMNANEAAILENINKLRVQSGLPPLGSSAVVQDIALYRTNDMQLKQYYSHTSPEGYSFKDLIPNGSGFGCENLLLTESVDPEEIVKEWAESPSHRNCILSEKITVAGISAAQFDQSPDATLTSQLVTFISLER